MIAEKKALLGLLLSLLVISTLLQALPDKLQLLVRYDRTDIITGAWWRLVSGHFLHLGWIHLALNMAGLGIIMALFWRYWTTRNFLLIFLVSLLAVSAGLWWVASDVQRYVGLSGILHGLLIAGAMLSFREERWYAVSMIAIVVAKLAWEQITQSSAGTAALIGGDVLFDAHLFGFTGGLLAILILSGRRFWQKP